jgi:hypothetical protein
MAHSYASVEEFRTSNFFVGLEETFTDTGDLMLQSFLYDVTAIVDNYCGRTFATGVYEEEFEGNNSNQRFLSQMPIIEVQEVSFRRIPFSYLLDLNVNCDSSVSGTIPTGSLIFTKTGLVKSQRSFSSDSMWKIKYLAGHPDSEIPQAIKTATMMLARIMADAIDLGNLGTPDGAAVNEFQFGKFRERYVAGTMVQKDKIDNLPITVAGILKRFKISH